MTGFLADENFNGCLIRGIRRHAPSVNILRIQDTAFMGIDDPGILDLATREDRLLLTHDVNTLIGYAKSRIAAGVRTCGVIEITRRIPVRIAVFDLQLISELLEPGEWDNRIEYLPL